MAAARPKEGRAMKLEQTIIIARPIEAVFAYRSGVGNTASWQPGVIACDPALPGVEGIGARWTEQRRGPNGSTEQWELEITEYEPNRVLGICGQCGTLRVAERHSFAPFDGNTRYTLAMETSGARTGTTLKK